MNASMTESFTPAWANFAISLRLGARFAGSETGGVGVDDWSAGAAMGGMEASAITAFEAMTPPERLLSGVSRPLQPMLAPTITERRNPLQILAEEGFMELS